MSTMHPDAQPPTAVAVLNLPELAEHLRSAGLDVVGGDTFRAAAAAVNAQLKSSPVAIVMADIAVPGTTPWVEKVLRTCTGALVQVDVPADGKPIGGNTQAVRRVPCPAPVDEILEAAGLAPLNDGAVLEPDGSVLVTFEPAVAPVGVPNVAGALAPEKGEEPAQDETLERADQVEDVGEDDPPEPAPEVEQVAAPAKVDFWSQAARPVAPVPVPSAPPVPKTDLWSDPETPPAPAVEAAPPGPVKQPVPAPPAAANPAPVSAGAHVGVETDYSPTLGRSLGKIIISVAGKGGVGKTSLAYALAQRAAVEGGLKTVLIDANRGQGDLRTYLSLSKAGLPTVYDAVTTGDPAAPIVTPDRLNANRPVGAEPLQVALVQAPPHGLADPQIVTSAVYREVIDAARAVADLVVVDTQIVEESERGMFDDLIIPMLANAAYCLGIADLSKPGIRNLVDHLSEFLAQGVAPDRIMTLINRAPQTTTFDQSSTSTALGQYGYFLGTIPADADIHSAMTQSRSIQDNPVLAPVLDQILFRVTGNLAFATHAHDPVTAAPRRRAGLFRRGRR